MRNSFQFPAGPFLFAASLCVLCLEGCGSGAVEEEVRDDYYAEVKVVIEDFAALYGEDKQRAQDEFPGLIEMLEGYANSPIGDQGDIMQELYSTASLIEEDFDNAEAVSQLNEQASQLPGDTAAIRQQMEEQRD